MHEPVGEAWLVWLETSALAMAMREWRWLYPVVEIAHIVGFVVLVGAAAMTKTAAAEGCSAYCSWRFWLRSLPP
jgi:hypothetical protein